MEGRMPWLGERGVASDCLVVFLSLSSPASPYLELTGHQAD